MERGDPMKVILIIFSLILNFNITWAQEFNFKNTVDQNWSYTPIMTRTDKNSVVKIKMFKRYLWINQTPVQVAETNFTYLKNSQEKIDLKSLSNQIVASFPEKTLTAHSTRNGIEIEGNWKKINRHIKMDLIKNGETFIVITTFARLGLIKSLMPELNELHSFLKTYDENKFIKTSFVDFFLQKAFAGNVTPGESGGLFGGSNITTGVGTNIFGTGLTTNGSIEGTGLGSGAIEAGGGTFGTSTGTFGTSLGGITGTLGGGVGGNIGASWGETNNIITTQGNTVNANLAETNNIINTQGNAVNANLAETNRIINTQGNAANANWAETNRQASAANTNWAESNKIAAKMMDPNHMAKLAFYTAAGAALGSITMNLAVEGVTAGISFLHELFTGTKKKQLEWEDFQKAIQSWDDQLGDMVRLERVVDEFISAFDFFNNKKMSNDYLKNLNIAMRDMRFDRDLMLERSKKNELAIGCRRILYNAADELDQKLKDYDKILQFASKHNIAGNNNENYFCQQLKELERKLLGAETQMQDLRLAILKAENQFYDKSTKSKEMRGKTVEEINGNMANTIKRREEYNNETTEDSKNTDDREKNEWVTECVAGSNGTGKQVMALYPDSVAHFFNAKRACDRVWDKAHMQRAREVKAQRILAGENKLRSDLKLNNNKTIDVKFSEEQMNWMTRIHMDAFCYQYAHVDEAKVPAKCKNFPEMLYSLKLSKGYENAKKAYDERCEDRYLKGIRKITKNN